MASRKEMRQSGECGGMICTCSPGQMNEAVAPSPKALPIRFKRTSWQGRERSIFPTTCPHDINRYMHHVNPIRITQNQWSATNDARTFAPLMPVNE